MLEVAAGPAEKPMREDLISALVNLGYHRSLAERAVKSALESAASDATFESLLKGSLQRISS